nr:hypothetical protein [uncultured Cohaesibacter sp.]
MRRFLLPAALFIMLGLPSLASAQQVHTPPKGDPERSTILNAVRPIFDVRLGKPIEFVVGWLRVYGDWAFVGVSPQRPGGGQIDSYTLAPELWEHRDNLFTVALLKHDYEQWNVVDYSIGPLDAYWLEHSLYKQFPKAFLLGQ